MTSISRSLVVDVGVAVLCAAAVVADGVMDGESAAGIALAALPAVALVWRRALPELVPVCLLGLVVASGGVGLDENTLESLILLLVWVVGAFSAGAYLHGSRLGAGAVLWLGVCAAMAVRLGDGAVDVAFDILVVACALVSGVVVGRHRRLTVAAHEQAALERARAAAAVVAERARIARELHDVVAHAVGIMVVQAGAAEQVLEQDPARARAALTAVQSTGRTAVAELGRMLGLLQSGEDWDRAPLPTLATVDQLVAQVKDAGVDVELTQGGCITDLPPALDLSAYRILQEGLTNAVKHAVGVGAVRVRVERDLDVLHLEVLDTGGRAAATGGTGHGLAGLRERVQVFGGRFDAGPHDGGFRVRASLPIAPGLVVP